MDERTKDFAQVAAEVKAWDAVLVENGDKVRNVMLTPLEEYEVFLPDRSRSCSLRCKPLNQYSKRLLPR